MKNIVFIIIAYFLCEISGYAKSNSDVYFMSSSIANTNDKGIYLENEITKSTSIDLFKASEKDEKVSIIKVGINDLQKDFDQRGIRNLVFYVHGYGKTIDEVYARAMLLQATYDVTVVFFFWPSKTMEGKFTNLAQAKRKINQSMSSFDQFVSLAGVLGRSKKYGNITLLAHSLGNYFLKQYAAEPMNKELKIYDNLLLNSAAVNSKNHDIWLSKLHFYNHAFVIYNKKDVLLGGLQIFTHAKRPLGKKAKPKNISKVEYINLSKLVGWQYPFKYTHSYFTGKIPNEIEQVKQIYAAILHGDRLLKCNLQKIK